MSSKFKNTAAILAIITGLGGAALAQTTTETAPAAPAAPAAPQAPVEITEDNLPEILRSLNLQDIDIDRDRRHTEVEGRLADGTQIEAKLDPSGELRKIEADDDAALPASVIEALVPEAVRGSDIFAQFAEIDEIGMPPAQSRMAGIMIEGTDANGEDLRAAFSEDGTMTRFGRGDDDDDDGGKRGKRGKRGDHGDRGDHGQMHGDRGEMRGDMRGGQGGEGGDMRGQDMQPPALLDEAAVTTLMTEAGYADLGSITRDGPRMTVEAVNAAGENVTVELNPRGEIVRETAR